MIAADDPQSAQENVPVPDPDHEANGAETDNGVLSPGSTATGAGTTEQ